MSSFSSALLSGLFTWDSLEGINSCVLDSYAHYVENRFYPYTYMYFSFCLSWLKYYALITSMSLFLELSGDKTNPYIIKLS